MSREIILLNGNTTAGITASMLAAAPCPAGFRLSGRTAPFGAPYIGDRASFAVASHAVVEMARALADEPPAAVVVACFGDPGLWAAREILPCPVVGMAEASLHSAAQMAVRFGIVTGGAAWRPMLAELAAAAGLGARLAHIEALRMTGAEIAANPEAALPALAEAVQAVADAGAGVAIMGGAALAGLDAPLRARAAIPILDGLACAVAQAVALAEVSGR